MEFTTVKQSMIRDLLEAASELNRANDTYRLAHQAAKLADTFAAYKNHVSEMVDELEELDPVKPVGTDRYSVFKGDPFPHAAPSLLTGREVLNGD